MKFPKRFIVLAALLVILLGGVSLAYASNGRENSDAGVAPEIEGTWLAFISNPSMPEPFPSLMTYARGGALIVTDSSGPPATGNVYQGTWTKTGPHQYTFTFMGLMYDETGALAGYFKTHETVTVEPGGNVYNGVSEGVFYDVDMKVLFTVSGTSHATRVPATE
jgi:hypothetical protein